MSIQKNTTQSKEMLIMSEMMVAERLRNDNGEMVADCTFEQRQAELEAEQAREQRIIQNERKSPYRRFIQMNCDDIGYLAKLNKVNPPALSILLFILDHMDGTNALICSYAVFEEALEYSRAAVAKGIKFLKDNNFIRTAKTGNAVVYYLNTEIGWKSWGTGYQYAEFNAKILLSKSENYDKVSDKKFRLSDLSYGRNSEAEI